MKQLCDVVRRCWDICWAPDVAVLVQQLHVWDLYGRTFLMRTLPGLYCPRSRVHTNGAIMYITRAAQKKSKTLQLSTLQSL